jgi:ubiquinone/menaquinone biosynthesis C-methylase UbiE
MPNPALMPTFMRELWVSRTLPREPEPDLVMEGAEQVAAYVEAGRIDGVMSASYLFHSARISQVLQGCKTVYDLGCGPATQLAQIAEFNPDIQFIGVDLSSTMLADAEKHIGQLGLGNVSFRQGDITTLESLADASADGVISTMALHHLPTFNHLENCFAAIKRVLKPGGALYLTDFGRLKSLYSVIFFAYMNAKHQPHLFSLDYERSLRAAFLCEEFEQLTARYFAPHAHVASTFKVPFLLTVKTQDHPLSNELRGRFQQMRRDLPRKYRGDLDDMRIFFRLGGLRDDPFSA